MTGDFWDLARNGIFRISSLIYQGPAPNEETISALSRLQVRDLLDVAGVSGTPPPGMTIHKRPFEDGKPIPDSVIPAILETTARLLSAQRPLFVHCSAGLNRSPTVVWLVAVACGLCPEEAAESIASKMLDGVPAHPRLLGQNTLQIARSEGVRLGMKPHLFDQPS